MSPSSISNSDRQSPRNRPLFWAVFACLIAVCAAIAAVLLLRLLLFQQPRSEVAAPADKAGQVSERLPVSTPDAVEPSMEISTAPQREPPPVPPLPDIFISDLKPRVFSSGWGQSGVNQSVIGNPLRIEGKTYEHGLGTHANGEAIFDIPPDARRFVAVVGLDDEVADDPWRRGSVCFEVYGEVNEPGEPPILLGQSPVLCAKTVRSWAFDLELESRFKRIELVVSDAGDDKDCDHADWVNAGFLKIPQIRTEAWNPQSESQRGEPVEGVQTPLDVKQTNWNQGTRSRLR